MAEPGAAAAFIGDITLVQSIWQILRCPQHNALVVFTPALLADNANRRVLARTAQAAIAQVLQTIGTTRQPVDAAGNLRPFRKPCFHPSRLMRCWSIRC